jgi:hypothetical protein
MTHSQKSFRLMLVADPRPAVPESAGAPVRRYRLARLPLEGRHADPAWRYEHLKRMFD